MTVHIERVCTSVGAVWNHANSRIKYSNIGNLCLPLNICIKHYTLTQSYQRGWALLTPILDTK